jgi:predicted ribosome quality control (RQC) complex YloA/Tae2 family protein
MHVDYLTLACLRDRLDALLGARVQRAILVDELSLGLELYAGERIQLLISAHPQHARMLITPHKLRRGVETPTPLLQLLRKWVRDARLTDVTQPDWERILTLHFEGRAGPCRLIAELIGRYSNVILVGPDGHVLDAVKRIGPDINRYRVTLPAHPYQPPPTPPGRLPPDAISPGEMTAILASAPPDQPLHRRLPRRLLGVSPMAAREIAARATGDPEASAGEGRPNEIVAAIAELFSPVCNDAAWSPHVALDAEGSVIAFAPYEPRQYPHIEPAPDVSTAMQHFFERRLSIDPYAAARRKTQRWIDEARARLERKQTQIESQVIDQAEIERLREAGELLLTYQHQVERGAREVALPDYAGQMRAIPLSPALTPVENAQDYFARYHKASRAAEDLGRRLAAVRPDLAYLDQLAADLAMAESRPEIDSVRDELVQAGWAPKPRRPSSKGQTAGPRRFEIDGFTIYVGRNARQNEAVTFDRAAPTDLWLHARGLPGAHVIITHDERQREAPEAVVRRAAQLAAYYSSARGERQVAVDVTERRFVRRVRGGRPGLVNYQNERTVWVEANGELTT